MSLSTDLQILTQPGSTGNQTYSLASNFDPCAVLVWAVPLAADGTAASWALGVGFGTYRGSVVQQRFVTMRGLDASGTGDVARGAGTDALLVLQTQTANAATRDLEIDLVSMQTGATSQVILNWANLHTTASIRVYMLAFGGSDITDALADNFVYPTASTTWDEPVGVSSIAYVGAGTAATATSGNVTPTLPAGSTGDLQLLHVAAADNVTVTVSGWTSVIATNQSSKLRQSIFSRVRAGGDGNPTVTHTGGSAIRARIFAWSGASAVDTSGAQGAAASATVTAPTVTPASAGSAHIWLGCEENTGDTSGTPTWAGYSDTAMVEIDDAAYGGGTDEISQAAAWNVNKSAAATGAVTATVTGESGTPDNNLGAHVILTPTTFSAVGQPDLVFFAGNGPLTEVATSPKFFFGFAKKGEAGRAVAFSQLDGNTASLVAMRQRSDRAILSIVATAGGGTDEALGQLDTTTANWPTNGFRAVFDANPASADACLYLALKGTFQSADGANTAVVAGSPPVTQDNAAGFAPKLGLVFGWNLAAATTMATSDADLGAFGIGAYDGTTVAWAGLTEDDAALTMDSNEQQETDHILANYSPSAALQSSATASFSGNNLRLSWDDIDSVARQYQWLALGDAAGGASITGDAALTGSATVAATGQVAVAGVAALAGSATVAAVGRVAVAGVAALSGTATVAPTGRVAVAGVAALAGSATLAAVGQVAVAGVATLAAAATLAADGRATFAGTATLAGSATLAAVGQVAVAGVVALAGSATLAADGLVRRNADAALTGSASLAAVGQVAVAGVAALAGSGTLSATGRVAVAGVAVLAGSATLAADGTVLPAGVHGDAALTGSATVTAVGRVAVAGVAALTGTATLTASAAGAVPGAAVLAGSATLAATGQVAVAGVAALATAAALTAAPSLTVGGAAALAGSATLVAPGRVAVAGVAALPASATLVAGGALTIGGAATLLASATLAASGTVIVAGTLAIEHPSGAWAGGEAGDWAGAHAGAWGEDAREGAWSRELVGTLSGGKRGEWS